MVEWTQGDQARVNAFEQQMLEVASQMQRDGHPDVTVMAFVQALGSLMRRRLQEDPSQLRLYQRFVEMLLNHVTASVPSPTADDQVKH
jgi:hypothetical protein